LLLHSRACFGEEIENQSGEAGWSDLKRAQRVRSSHNGILGVGDISGRLTTEQARRGVSPRRTLEGPSRSRDSRHPRSPRTAPPTSSGPPPRHDGGRRRNPIQCHRSAKTRGAVSLTLSTPSAGHAPLQKLVARRRGALRIGVAASFRCGWRQRADGIAPGCAYGGVDLRM
jgi:hypothetical protein